MAIDYYDYPAKLDVAPVTYSSPPIVKKYRVMYNYQTPDSIILAHRYNIEHNNLAVFYKDGMVAVVNMSFVTAILVEPLDE